MASLLATKQNISPQYEILYWPGTPGRAAPIRLALEAAGVGYRDVANESKENINEVLNYIDTKSTGDTDGNPPVFAPPILRIAGAAKDGKALVLHQTGNILAYLGDKIGLVPEDEGRRFHVAQIALTALDLYNEAHDTHHPIAVSKYYEDQRDECLKRATDFRENRIPKFFGYFERVLQGNEKEGKRKYLVGSELTYADTTVWSAIEGLYYAFPKELAARSDEFPLLLGNFYPSIKARKAISEYLSSDRCLKYSMGIFRSYPELDRQ